MAVGVLIAWLVAVAVLTLRPSSLVGELTLEDFLCLWCSTRPAVDKILNLLMFVPGGIALRALVGTRRTILIAAGLTMGIEALQVAIPGRHPSLMDIVLNTAGAATGAWVYRTGPTRGLLGAAGVAAAVVWLAPTVLLTPTPRDSQLYANWTPVFGGQPTYSGEVLRAELDGIDLRYRLERSGEVRAALSERGALEVDFVVGREAEVPTYVFGLWDAEQNPNFTISAYGPDLLIGWWSPARTLGLGHVPLRARDALAGRAAGDTVGVVVEHVDGRWCVAVDGTPDCAVSPGVETGWGLILDSVTRSAGTRRLLELLWAVGVGAILGLGMIGPGRRASTHTGVIRGTVAASAVAGAGVAGAWMSPELVVDLPSAVALVAGGVAGAGLGARLGTRYSRSRSIAN